MGGLLAKNELSQFQKNKFLHEFNTFFDFNKDGVLEWKDLVNAREKICELSGWKTGTEKHQAIEAVFSDLWRHLQDDGDENLDGRITQDEWLAMWRQLHFHYLDSKKEKNACVEEVEDSIPRWLEDYIKYKFDLLDRTADGKIDVDEFEYVMTDFGVSPKDARTAFLLFSYNNETQSNQTTIDLPCFRKLSIEYFRSNEPSQLGNFITGRLDFT